MPSGSAGGTSGGISEPLPAGCPPDHVSVRSRAALRPSRAGSRLRCREQAARLVNRLRGFVCFAKCGETVRLVEGDGADISQRHSKNPLQGVVPCSVCVGPGLMPCCLMEGDVVKPPVVIANLNLSVLPNSPFGLSMETPTAAAACWKRPGMWEQQDSNLRLLACKAPLVTG